MYDRHCINKPLTKLDKIQIMGDYVIAIGGTFILSILYYFNYIPKEIIELFYVGFLLGCPFEFIQPRIGWIFYYKCITYKVAPRKDNVDNSVHLGLFYSFVYYELYNMVVW